MEQVPSDQGRTDGHRWSTESKYSTGTTLRVSKDRTYVSSLSGEQDAFSVQKTLIAPGTLPQRAHFSRKDHFLPQIVSTLSAQVRMKRDRWWPWSKWALIGLWEARVTLQFSPLLSECCF